jgi:integrase
MRRRFRFTQPSIDKLKPPTSGRDEYADASFPGFELRISAPRPGREAHRAWRQLLHIDGKQVPITIPFTAYPSLKEAHDRARQILRQLADGSDPREEKRLQKVEEEQQKAVTAAAVADRYFNEYAQHRMRPKYFNETQRAFKVDILPKIGDVPLDKLTRRHIREVIGAIVARGRVSYADHVRHYLHAWLDWAVAEELIEANPAAGIPNPDPRKGQDRERDRYLNNDEIQLFWSGCEQIGEPFGSLFKLLLLTGARRDELAHATWDEFNFGKREWTLPRRRSKNDKVHITHLAPLAIEILEALPRVSECRFLFTTNGRTPISGFGHACRRLRAVLPDVPHFTLHDLRRTLATGMADLGIAEHVLDRVLNHTGRKVSGTARIYNRHEYLRERQEALQAWGRHIESLVRPTPSNVVKLATAHR